MSAWEIYLIGQADTLIEVLSCVAAVLFSLVAFSALGILKDVFNIKLPVRPIVCLMLMAVTLAAAIPSSKTCALMYAVPAITQNENFKALPDDIAVFLRRIMREWDKGDK